MLSRRNLNLMSSTDQEIKYSSFNISSERPIISVTMATSRQGQSVVKHLSDSNLFRIRAITRECQTPRAIRLAKLNNVEIVKGDLLNKSSLKEAFEGSYGIFGNTSPTKNNKILIDRMDNKYEIIQGQNLIDVIEDLRESDNLKHFIFSSICKAKLPLLNDPAPQHFRTKWNIEELIMSKSLKDITTIMRPVSYFENFDSKIPNFKITNKMFPGIVDGNKPWQTIAVDDIGLWAKAIFSNRQRFVGSSLNLASEELTGNEMAKILTTKSSDKYKNITYSKLPRFIINILEHDIGIMAGWIERAGYGANIKELKALSMELGFEMTSLSSWLENRKLNISL